MLRLKLIHISKSGPRSIWGFHLWASGLEFRWHYGLNSKRVFDTQSKYFWKYRAFMGKFLSDLVIILHQTQQIICHDICKFVNGLASTLEPKYFPKHNDAFKWEHFPRYWPFVRGSHQSPVDSFTKASHAELWCLFDLRLNKRLSKQSGRRWFETSSRSL